MRPRGGGFTAAPAGCESLREQADQTDKSGHETEYERAIQDRELNLPDLVRWREGDFVDPALSMRDVVELCHACF
jgi:hypothetical protein